MDTKKKGVLRRVLSGAKTLAASPVNAYKNVKAALSIPYYVIKGNKAAKDANTIKTARSYEGAPNLGGMSGKEPTDAMKARSLARDVIIKHVGRKRAAAGANSRALGY